MRRADRRGFSLLEVILATAILLGSTIVLFELASIGRAHIESTEDLAAAQRICETRINEMLAGAAPIQVVENEPLDEEAGWTITVSLDSVEHMAGLAALRVTVAREAGQGHRAKRYTLVRWIRDPQVSRDPADSSSAAPVDAPPAEPSP
jgi:prepilin-type N-terminal cleavage/methylation domain-containing protein